MELYRKPSRQKELNRKGRKGTPWRFLLGVLMRLSLFRLLRSQKNRVKSPHDSPRPARHPGVPGVQKAAGAEKRRTESEVRRVPPRLPGPGRNSDHAGGRS